MNILLTRAITQSTFWILFSVVILTSCGAVSEKVNSPPTITIESFSNPRVGEYILITPSAADADGDSLSFSVQGLPVWANFDFNTGVIDGIPLTSDLGNISEVTLSVSDGKTSVSAMPIEIEVIKPIFFVSVSIDSMDPHRTMEIILKGCLLSLDSDLCQDDEESLVLNENGVHTFNLGVEANYNFELEIEREPGRQDCTLSFQSGVMDFRDELITVNCQDDQSAAIFSNEKMHKIRLTIDKDEWKGFALDSERSSYRTVGDANGILAEWYFRTHSEVYRKVDFDYLNDSGASVANIKNVAFKMRGASTRQWPEYFEEESSGVRIFKPTRFSFTLKFDEEFEDDESVYSCIDAAGIPSFVSEEPCSNRISRDHDEITENDGRRFMDVKKLSFRYNMSDPSYQRELLAHSILNASGVPSSRAAHANIELHIIGEGDLYGLELPLTFNLGVYQMVEQVNKVFLKRFFGKNGYLFKGSVVDLTEASLIDSSCVHYEDSAEFVNEKFCAIGVEKPDPESREEWVGAFNYFNPNFVNSDINDGENKSQFRPYRPILDAKTKKKSIDDGREALQTFISFLQSSPESSALAEKFDVPGFIKAQAVDIVIGAVDHYTRVANNYYLYLNPITERWTYIPYDYDFSFRDSHDLTYGTPDRLSAFRDIVNTYAMPSNNGDRIHWAGRVKGGIEPILWHIIFSDYDNRNDLYKHIKEILEFHFNWSLLETELRIRNSLIEEAVLSMDAISIEGCQYEYNPLAIDASEETELCDLKDISIKTYIEQRKNTLITELQEVGFIE